MTRTNRRIHFMHRHVRDMTVILEEGKRPHPLCPACDMFVPWAAMNHHHPATTLCAWVSDRKRQLMVEVEARAGAATAFQEYVQTLKTVT